MNRLLSNIRPQKVHIDYISVGDYLFDYRAEVWFRIGKIETHSCLTEFYDEQGKLRGSGFGYLDLRLSVKVPRKAK